MSKKVLVPIANGTEEMEAVITIDTLVRAGADVTVASVEGLTITASRGVKITADILIDEIKDEEFDAIAIPGGMPGAEAIGASKTFIDMLKKHIHAGKLYAAICAAPAVVLKRNGLLNAEKATCFPAFENELEEKADASGKSVVKNGKCITSKAAGTAFDFALEIAEELFGADVKEKLKASLIYKC